MALGNAVPAIGARGFYSGQLHRNYIPATERRLSFAKLQIFVECNLSEFVFHSEGLFYYAMVLTAVL